MTDDETSQKPQKKTFPTHSLITIPKLILKYHHKHHPFTAIIMTIIMQIKRTEKKTAKTKVINTTTGYAA